MIDFAAHIIPPRMWARIDPLVGPMTRHPVEANPGLVDLDIRRRTIDYFAGHGYRQLLSVSLQGTEDPAVAGILPDLCRAANEELREIVDRDQALIGALGALPLALPAAALPEVDHIVELGLAGFQVYSSVAGRPLDEPATLEVLEYALSRGLVCLLHPVRGPVPDYLGEERSRLLLFRILGWPYETSLAMVRLAFSGVLERQPQAVIVAHHLGAMIPYFAARIESHYSRTNDPELTVDLPRPPMEYLHRFHGDTALNGGPHAVRCGVDFFGAGQVVFGSDYPFDNNDGLTYIRSSIDAVEGAGLAASEREAIFEGNARRLLGMAGD
jgi:aminocarboxymuconate-semialdehyde decarboxylase